MKQGPWTRIRPLQIDEVDDYTASAYKQGELTWGHFPNNLMKMMGHCPQLAITEVPYANSFIFDIDVFNHGKQFAGFADRPLKELMISRTSLYNASRYSITHHSFIGYSLFKALGRGEEGHRKLLNLHEHENHRGIYTDRENACLDYAVKVAKDPHLVSDDEFNRMKAAMRAYNTGAAPGAQMTDFDRAFIAKWVDYDNAAHDRLVDSQLVELTWLIGQFCLLNRWFTALQVPDEGPDDELNFLGAYVQVVPQDIRDRNERILQGRF
jgi:alkylhydroperoxidase family enzyme